MPAPSRIRLSVHSAGEIADYVRRVRLETLRAIRMEPSPALVEPVARAVYLVAYAEGQVDPVGLVEAAFLHQVYGSYEELPYSKVFDLRRVCAFEQLAGVRTVYVDPAFRAHHALYLKLIIGQSQVFSELGARWAVATTDSGNERLCRLYEKTGGQNLGTWTHDGSTDPIALFLFSIERLARHPLAARCVPDSAWRSSLVFGRG